MALFMLYTVCLANKVMTTDAVFVGVVGELFLLVSGIGYFKKKQ